MPFFRCFANVLAILASLAVCEAVHYQVYLLGGQSNGNGRADAAQLTPPLDSQQTDVRLYWHRTQEVTNAGHLLEDQWIDLAPGSGCGTGAPVYAKEFGSEVSFGRSMADAKPSENIAIIKYTHGGTNLQGSWSATGFQYTTFVATVQAGLAALTSDGHSYELKGMLWQQGEADTGGVAADNYQTNLENLIARVRTDLNGGEPFPFVIGSLSDSQYASTITVPGTGSYKVRQAQETVAANDPTVGIVITDGYSTRPADSIHFDHTAQITLGESFTDRMLELENPLPPSVGRPNVIFILSDDQSWYDYSFMYRANVEKSALDANAAVKQVAETPAIDRLADEGLTFTHGYTTPLCRPSLASMITGTYPHQSWITGNDLVGRVPDQAVEARMQVLHPLPRTLASYLGYTSFQTGKWWEGHHTNGGFTAGDTVNSTAGGTAPTQWGGAKPSYVTARHGDWGLMTGRVDYVNDVEEPVLPAPGAVNPISYANTVKTVTDFIDAQAGFDQPFFVWYAPFLPHTPHDPPADLLNKYLAKGLNSGDARYYANVERFDGGVGAILDHLDSLGIADNTMVVMICDNGRDMPDGKRSPYDGGIRTPIIVHWPDQIKPGGLVEPQVVTTPVSLVDMVPTVHHALGLPVFPEMTGVNLLDLGAVQARDTVFMEDNHIEIQDLPNPSASLEARVAIRDGWKLILFADNSTELYHLYDSTTGAPVDPFENSDLSASNPTLVGELITAINDWYDAPKGQQVTNSEAASFTVSDDDLLQTSLDATTPVSTTGTFTDVGGITVTGEPSLRNGVWENDGSGRADSGTSNGATATYYFDLTASPLGYTIDQIDLFSNWGPAQDHDEIRVSIDYSVVGSPTNFDNHIVIDGVYNPPTETQGKMSITNIGTAGVAAIRFTWPASQEGGSVGYSEIDVLGSPNGSDTNPPVLSSVTPSDGGTHILDANLVAIFSEPIQAGTGFIHLYEADDTLVESFDVSSSPRLDISGSRVEIDPTDDLVGGTSYYVKIDATAFNDLAGNSFAGIDDEFSWNFTADGTAPGVNSTVPVNGAGDVLPTSLLTIQFDELVQLGSGNITIHLANGTVDQTIAVNSGAVSVAGSTVTIDPPADLALNTAYYVNISSGAIKDLSGNTFTGISGSTAWAFTTTATVMLHHWTFDVDGSDSAGSADTTIETGASITSGGMGMIGEALSVPSDAVGAVTASVGAVTLPESDFTFTAWVKPDPSSPDGNNTVMGNQNNATHGAFLRIDDEGSDGDLFARVNNASGSLIEGGTVDKNVWTHVAMTVSSTAGLTIYVDGVPQGNNPAGTSHVISNLPFEIGTRASNGTQDFWGLIDDVRIYGVPLSQSEIAALAEVGGGPGDPSPVTSTVAASPSAVPADGTTTSTITVTVKDAGSLPVPARSVSLAGNTGNATITAVNATTDANGQATFTVRSNNVGTEVFTATDVTGGGSLAINQTASVDFQTVVVVGPVNAGESTVVASPTAVPANGSSSSTITVTLKDAAGLAVQGEGVSLSGSTGNATISTPNPATTDTNGQATFTVSSSTVETEIFTATSVTDSVGITQTASVNFQAFSAPAGLLFYEPFDYTPGSLNGQGGWSVVTGDIQVSANGVTNAGTGGYTGADYTGSYSGVTTTGGYIHNSDTVADYGSVALAPSVTSTFTDGSVTWFSMINVRGDNGSNGRYGLAIGADVLTGQRWGNEMAGDGIGFTTGTNNATNAAVWTPNGAGDDYTLGADVPGGTGRDRFEVAKITWGVGAGVDTIEIAFFDAGETMTEAAWDAKSKSTASADLDQSTFDTLSFTSGSVNFDEIRIATSFDLAVIGTVISGGSGYATWSGGEPFDGDKNGDTVENGIAFLLGAVDSDANALGLLPTSSENGSGGLILTFSLLNVDNRGDSQLAVEHSSDLGISDAWVGALVPDVEGVSEPVNGVLFDVTLGDPLNEVTATIQSSEAVDGQLFGRLRGTEQ